MRGRAAAILPALAALVALPGSAAEVRSLDRACAAAFGEGFRGQIEIATGGPICARPQGVAIEYRRPDPAALCPGGRAEVLEEGRAYRCGEGTEATADGPGLPGEPSGVLMPLPRGADLGAMAPGAEGAPAAARPPAEARPSERRAAREVVRPLDPDETAADGAPGARPASTGGAGGGSGGGAGGGSGVGAGGGSGGGSDTAAAPEATAPQPPGGAFAPIPMPIDLGGLTPAPGIAAPSLGSPIDPETEAEIAAVMGADWRGRIADGVMPRVDLEVALLEGGFREVRTVVTPCHRSEVPASGLLPGIGSPGAGGIRAPTGSPTLPGTVEGIPVALPSTEIETGAPERLLFVAEALRLRREAGQDEDLWRAVWEERPDPLGLGALARPGVCGRLSAPALGAIDAMIGAFSGGVDPATLPTLESYVLTANELASLLTLCEDILRYRAANLAWTAHCAPLDPALQSEVLSRLPETPPALEALVEGGLLTPLIPAEASPLAEDDGAAADAAL